ncbi:MAG: hypothetical protein ACI87N_001563 [Flavobacteriales bacterium]
MLISQTIYISLDWRITYKTKIMGIINDKRKFKISKKQTFPTNPTGNPKMDNKQFEIKRDSIKDSKTKE